MCQAVRGTRTQKVVKMRMYFKALPNKVKACRAPRHDRDDVTRKNSIIIGRKLSGNDIHIGHSPSKPSNYR